MNLRTYTESFCLIADISQDSYAGYDHIIILNSYIPTTPRSSLPSIIDRKSLHNITRHDATVQCMRPGNAAKPQVEHIYDFI